MHLDNLLFILLIAIAALFRFLASKAGDTAKKNSGPTPRGSTSIPRTDNPVPRAPVDTDEERIRRFLDALGQPASSKPPAPVVPRPTYQKPMVLPHIPPFGPPHPPLVTRPPEEPARKMPRPPPIVVPAGESQMRPPAAHEAPVFEVQKTAAPVEQTRLSASATAEQTGTSIVTLLSSPSGLRDAIILREIFGPPRSLQPLDLIGSP